MHPTLLKRLPLFPNRALIPQPHLPSTKLSKTVYPPGSYQLPSFHKNPGSRHWMWSILQLRQLVFSRLHPSRQGPPLKGTAAPERPEMSCAKSSLGQLQPGSSCLASLYAKFHCPLFLLLQHLHQQDIWASLGLPVFHNPSLTVQGLPTPLYTEKLVFSSLYCYVLQQNKKFSGSQDTDQRKLFLDTPCLLMDADYSAKFRNPQPLTTPSLREVNRPANSARRTGTG